MVEDDARDGPDDGAPEATTDGERTDLYYHGIVRRLSHRKNSGVIRTASGRDIRFSYQLVHMSGPVTSPKALKEGMVVGYDLGWTGHGLRVTRIKTYLRPGRDRPASTSVSDGKPAETDGDQASK